MGSSTVFHPLRVAAVETLTDDAAVITFDVAPDVARDFDFAAGQSVVLQRRVDGQVHRRSYSLCSAVGAPPRIGVREIPGGLFSTWLVRDVRPGDVVEVAPPSGRWRADTTRGEQHLCIAAGSGITPMLSIAASVLAHPDAGLTLLYGNRTTTSVMFADELADLKDRYGARLHLVHVLSREPRSVELLSGRLDAERLRRILDTVVDVGAVDHVWLCGPHGLIVGAQQVLEERGVAGERVHVEHFHVDEPPPGPVRTSSSPSTGSSADSDAGSVGSGGPVSDVTIVLDGHSSSVSLPRGRTVLDGAQAVRADLPFACKGGVCGTCRARVVEGEVDLRRNYALDRAELDAGFVLACQAYPLSEAVVLDFDA